MTSSQEAIVTAQLNSVMNNIELFKSSTSADWEAVNYPKRNQREKIIELYAYLYKHPEIVVSLFNMDKDTFYFDKFLANNTIVSIGGTMIVENIGPSEAIKLYKKRFR